LKDRAISHAPRRRRSWYRRQLRIQRTVATVVLFTLIAVVCALNVSRFSSHGRYSSLVSAGLLPGRANLHPNLSFPPPSGVRRHKYVSRIPGIYPYSVVPGGVKDIQSLRRAASHDAAVARHFSRFDFKHARIERVTTPREVYVSYRIRDTVFWTHRKIRLRAGELLLTDGNIAARLKCGNQISDTAKPDVSDEEPQEDILDQPVAYDAPAPPFSVRPTIELPDLPVGSPIASSGLGGGFSFPYAPIGGGPPVGICRTKDGKIDKRCEPKHKKPVIPEPSTFILFAAGLALVASQYKSLRPSAIA
jgi:hypothetical protein